MKTYMLPKGSLVKKLFFSKEGIDDVDLFVYTNQDYCFDPEQIAGATSFSDGINMFTELCEDSSDEMWIVVDKALSIQIQPSQVRIV